MSDNDAVSAEDTAPPVALPDDVRAEMTWLLENAHGWLSDRDHDRIERLAARLGVAL